MKTIKSLLIMAAVLATPALAHAADGDSKKSVAIFAALIAVFAGVGTTFLAVYAANVKKNKK
ncbi:hypothetical protein SGCZBJ_08590 [Caulobacter zeae]|uniref:Uncharacterized protein n=1 Tax=Caulobacter zeae TaxID=2055137 RepID=A0A2N5DL79_9CAUL|nr:hypothetical protein [Caulobacter zeae]PLR26810.1 hypothetical protein SGCZBJ_08590 [Caulobacter zeae]